MGIARLFTFPAVVETLQGSAGFGENFAAPVTVMVFPNDGTKVVRDSQGEEVVSVTTLYASLDQIGLFAIKSKVTFAGRTGRVVAAVRREVGPASAHHCQISLT